MGGSNQKSRSYTSGSLTVRTLETKSSVIFLKKMSIILLSLEWRHSTGRKLAGLTIVLNILKVPQGSPVSFWGQWTPRLLGRPAKRLNVGPGSSSRLVTCTEFWNWETLKVYLAQLSHFLGKQNWGLQGVQLRRFTGAGQRARTLVSLLHFFKTNISKCYSFKYKLHNFGYIWRTTVLDISLQINLHFFF